MNIHKFLHEINLDKRRLPDILHNLGGFVIVVVRF
jgi:hypothetical protein